MKLICKRAYFVLYCILRLQRETVLLCCKVAVGTTNLQLKQFNGNFDTCICLVHLLPFYTSKMITDQPGLWMYRIQIFNADKKRDNNLYEFISFCF